MNHYENVVIFQPELSEEKVDSSLKKIADLIINNKGEIISQEKWGRKKLAYPIHRQTEGNFIIIEFKIEPHLISKLESQLRVDANIMRYMVVKKELKKKQTKKD